MWDPIHLSRETIDGKRYYETPDGKFKSVTTILSEVLDSSGLDAWEERIGIDEANKIRGMAASRGRALHEMAEKYLHNEEDWWKGHITTSILQFNKVAEELNWRVENIRLIESQLYSAELKAAGTCDLICDFKIDNDDQDGWFFNSTLGEVEYDPYWEGHLEDCLSVVDFKTARSKVLYKAQKEKYFTQAAAYAIMAEELYEEEVPQLVIVWIREEHDPVILSDYTDAWREKVAEVFG